MLAHKAGSRGVAAVEFALITPLLFLLLMGIFDFGRAVIVDIALAEGATEGARVLVLRTSASITPPDQAIMDAVLAKVGGTLNLIEDPCIAGATTPCPSTPSMPNQGYVWLTQNRPSGNGLVTVRIAYYYAPYTSIIASAIGSNLILVTSSTMRQEY
jgi:Flp pilus assembly protein TadG